MIYTEFLRRNLKAKLPQVSNWRDGSIANAVAGAAAVTMQELSFQINQSFLKLFLQTAKNEDLDKLVFDKYGEAFKRPEGRKSQGYVTFRRPEISLPVRITAGTIVKSSPDINGDTIEFRTVEDVFLINTEIKAKIESVTSGSNTNVLANTIKQIVSNLPDESIECDNENPTILGMDQYNDDEFRKYVRAEIAALKYYTNTSIVEKIKELPVIERVTERSAAKRVQETSTGKKYNIVVTTLYVCDADGNYSQTMLDVANLIVRRHKAEGTNIFVEGAEAFKFNWKANIKLNPEGRNFNILSQDLSMIKDDMKLYADRLDIGEDFITSNADFYMLQKWGPSGTNDLVDFSTKAPAADIVTNDKQVFDT